MPAVIGVRPEVQFSPGDIDTEAASDAIAGRLSTQLDDALSVESVREDSLGSGQVPADGSLGIRPYEKLVNLQQLGVDEIGKRLQAIATVRAAIAGDANLTDPQKKQILAQLDAATAGLNQLKTRILVQDTLPDMARADLVAIATNFRVDGLLLPAVHLYVAAYDTQRLAAAFSDQRKGLQQRLGNRNIPAVATQLADLQAQIKIMNDASQLALAKLPTLTPAGYPGNRPDLLNIGTALANARAAAATAGIDAIAARTALDSCDSSQNCSSAPAAHAAPTPTPSPSPLPSPSPSAASQPQLAGGA